MQPPSVIEKASTTSERSSLHPWSQISPRDLQRTCQTGRQEKVSLYWLTPMGSIELVISLSLSADRSCSRNLSAYQVHKCGISSIRLASHHLSVTRLHGFPSPSTRLLGRGSEQEHHDRLRGLNHLMEDIVLAADSADSAHLTRSARFALEQAGSLRAAGPQALPPFV